MGRGRNVAIVVIILFLAVGVFAFTVRVFPVSYQESYQVDVPYDEQQAYTVQVPYTTVEDRQGTIGSTSDYTLEGGYYTWWNDYIPLGRDIEFSVSASDTVNLYVFTSTQFTNLQEMGSWTPNEKQLLDVSNGKLGYHVSSSGTYYFVIRNPHSGIFGIGKKNVGIYSALIKAYWQEEVTKYRSETRYRTVTKYRTETHYRTIDLRVTLWELITGSYHR